MLITRMKECCWSSLWDEKTSLTYWNRAYKSPFMLVSASLFPILLRRYAGQENRFVCTAEAKMPTFQVTDLYRLLWLLDSSVEEGFHANYASASINIKKRLPNTHENSVMVQHAFRLKWCGLESECVIWNLFNSTPMSCHFMHKAVQ